MKNLKATIKTEDIINSIKANVNLAIKYYNDNNDLWETHVNIALFQLRTLSLQGFKIKSDFSSAWDELMESTGFEKLHHYYGISEYINKL